jgi:hypothetical protein
VLIVIGPGYLEVLVRLDLDPVLPRGDAGVIFKCEVRSAPTASGSQEGSGFFDVLFTLYCAP